MGVLEVLPKGGFNLLETAPGVSIETIQNATEGKLLIDKNLKKLNFKLK